MIETISEKESDPDDTIITLLVNYMECKRSYTNLYGMQSIICKSQYIASCIIVLDNQNIPYCEPCEIHRIGGKYLIANNDNKPSCHQDQPCP